MTRPPEELEEVIGYSFGDRQLLTRALTHRSWFAERASPEMGEGDNEQLEFLGDSILGFLVSWALIERFPTAREGRLSQLKAYLVSASHLHKCALEAGLGDFLVLGKGEERNGGRERKTLLANAFEALIAALHLDGGLDVAKAFVHQRVLPSLDEEESWEAQGGVLNYKSLLQERSQALRLSIPKYLLIATSGPEHAKQFTVEAQVGKLKGRATASSKKDASQRAAEILYGNLQSAQQTSIAQDQPEIAATPA